MNVMTGEFKSGCDFPGLQPKDTIGFVRPMHFVGPHVPFPIANMSHLLCPLQVAFTGGQRAPSRIARVTSSMAPISPLTRPSASVYVAL